MLCQPAAPPSGIVVGIRDSDDRFRNKKSLQPQFLYIKAEISVPGCYGTGHLEVHDEDDDQSPLPPSSTPLLLCCLITSTSKNQAQPPLRFRFMARSPRCEARNLTGTSHRCKHALSADVTASRVSRHSRLRPKLRLAPARHWRKGVCCAAFQIDLPLLPSGNWGTRFCAEDHLSNIVIISIPCSFGRNPKATRLNQHQALAWVA